MPRRTKKADRTRASLLKAALRVISRKGYTAATVEEIVKEAGVSKGLAYYHFKNKAALAAAVLQDGVDSLIAEFERIAAESSHASEALMGMFDAFADVVVDNKEFGRFFSNELWRNGRVWSDEMHEREQRLVAVISDQFRRGQEEGTIDASSDATFMAVASIGLVLTTSVCYFSERPIAEPIDKEEFAARVYAFVRKAALS